MKQNREFIMKILGNTMELKEGILVHFKNGWRKGPSHRMHSFSSFLALVHVCSLFFSSPLPSPLLSPLFPSSLSPPSSLSVSPAPSPSFSFSFPLEKNTGQLSFQPKSSHTQTLFHACSTRLYPISQFLSPNSLDKALIGLYRIR